MPDKLSERFLGGEFRRNIYLSVKEALHNIVKHAQATQVNVKIACADTLTIIISDNGIGLSHKAKAFSNGLENMKNRMKNIGGSFEIENKNGTTVKLTVPLAV
jgi:signal transduction histidine kinase